tara:strand:- start:243 stop:458 length:216 start_codon:yes stop_codon:yes gene_type:complete
MNDDNIDKLLHLSQQIVELLDDKESLTLTQEEKASLENILSSMQFFSAQGNLERSISEAELVINKIKESYS